MMGILHNIFRPAYGDTWVVRPKRWWDREQREKARHLAETLNSAEFDAHVDRLMRDIFACGGSASDLMSFIDDSHLTTHPAAGDTVVRGERLRS